MSVWIWLALIVAFVILEAATAQMVSMWFILGSVAAFIVALCSGGIILQLVAFVVVSGISLLAFRPFVKKQLEPEKTPTNADMVIGKIAVITETVNNELGQGRAVVDGVTWTARSNYGDIMEKDTKAMVFSIEGVKLILVASKEG